MAKESQIVIRLETPQRRRISRIANRKGLTPAAWSRSELLAAVEREEAAFKPENNTDRLSKRIVKK